MFKKKAHQRDVASNRDAIYSLAEAAGDGGGKRRSLAADRPSVSPFTPEPPVAVQPPNRSNCFNC